MRRNAALLFIALASLIFADSTARRSGSAAAGTTSLAWNTFLGPAADPYASSGASIASDRSGNVYLAGLSNATWGNPIDPLNPIVPNSGYSDVFVAKLNAQGVLQWNTFLGIFSYMSGSASTWDYLRDADIAVDPGGNVYVVCSKGDWTYAGGETYVAKFNSFGARQWLVSLGGGGTDIGQCVAVDGAGNVYVGGTSNVTWGAPVHPFADNISAFFAKLNSSGVVLWNTFWGPGSSKAAICHGIAVDGNGNVYGTGRSYGTWGSPIRPYTPSSLDAFVVKLDGSGIYLWNTFLGAATDDMGTGIKVDADGNSYIAGSSSENWGLPVAPFHGYLEAFVAKLDPSGGLVWNSFIGSSNFDMGRSLDLDASRNSYLTGLSMAGWGSPDRPFTPNPSGASRDAFVVKLDSGGNPLWNTFLGGAGYDYGQGIGIDPIGNVFVTGQSGATWGAPILPFPGTRTRAFAAKIDVTQQKPILGTSKSEITFGAVAGGPKSPNQQFRIFNAGPGILDWTLTSNRPWLSAAPTSGYGAATITVSVDPSGLTAGSTDTGSIQIVSTTAFNSPQAVAVRLNVTGPGGTLPPFGSFDTPLNGAAGITGAIPVTGWALDDIGMEKVEIWRDPVLAAGEVNSLYYIGSGLFVEGARPDIETIYPGYPGNSTAGWGYMLLTNMLPGHGNGIYRLHAFATDKEGNVVLLGTRIIGCDNANAVKPFGTIDTPSQGGTASGNRFVNFGWVLTPMPKTLPLDGSTIQVYVDGILLGDLQSPNVYNAYRKDVADNFPGLNNSNGPVGAFFLDTTQYANGIHTIWWMATDNQSQWDGIGSRFFMIDNAGGSPQPGLSLDLPRPSAAALAALPHSFAPLRVKIGFDPGAEFAPVFPDKDGVARVEIREVSRVEIELGEEARGAGRIQTSRPRFSGCLPVGNDLRPLPIGSTLNQRTGRFSWMPGPGFLGTYGLTFLKDDGKGGTGRILIEITILPK